MTQKVNATIIWLKNILKVKISKKKKLNLIWILGTIWEKQTLRMIEEVDTEAEMSF